ncbi:ion channel [Flagellimonas sp. CMM7]|uniref:ion channel n=1 Tax=Flagellimonas sp. CMM7 TaxID=2654676 RepID=UPI0013D158D2|nr:ion channel [Flagellimonas sp. CMM7]UII78779.1 ion channel [Flagellimonas sp. CMM7]
MTQAIYKNRFEFFLATQLAILFGSLLFGYRTFEYTVQPILFLMNILGGILLISKQRKLMWFFILLFTISLFIFGSSMVSRTEGVDTILIRLSIYFLFCLTVTVSIIKQIWYAKDVNKNVIIGLVSGYISLGFLAFFLFMSIELLNTGAFQGVLLQGEDFASTADSIMYYSFITLLTIGYGEIVPTIAIAQKAAILVGLMGQFYMVIITAIIVGKYIQQNTSDDNFKIIK